MYCRAEELMSFDPSSVGRFRFHHRITLTLQLSDLREHQFQPSKQTLEFGMCVCRVVAHREQSAIRPDDDLGSEAMGCNRSRQALLQNSSDPVGETDALGDEFARHDV